MFERFTVGARTVVVAAQEDARERKQAKIRTENLLVSLYRDQESAAVALLREAGVEFVDVEAEVERLASEDSTPDAGKLALLGIDFEEVRKAAEETFGPGALERTQAGKQRRMFGHIPFDESSKKALELSLREALRLKHKEIRSEHVLLGLLHAEGGAAHHILAAKGVTLDGMREAVAGLGEAG
ncbi:Clp protease N-terminal domain-containing protein [Pseudonocardia pini]|uniref:Clp protease N-terminal domain-containing protein n=1 Tax=Pseudonocardia pini TaxID=2758030 RepID=UPI0015F105C1|nr:Clp protease N-terminal domain-containing protein [Pseudonocardia pini]